MKPSLFFGEISSGAKLFKTERSVKLMETRLVDMAAVERIPVVFFTDLILSIGRRVGLKNIYTIRLLPSISYQHPNKPMRHNAVRPPHINTAYHHGISNAVNHIDTGTTSKHSHAHQSIFERYTVFPIER